MYCSQCGNPVDASSRFCPACGTALVAQLPSQIAPPVSRLLRPRSGRMVAGLCAGLALHYGWDITLVRLLCVLLALFTGVGLIAYLVAWVVIPEEPYMLPHSSTGSAV